MMKHIIVYCIVFLLAPRLLLGQESTQPSLTWEFGPYFGLSFSQNDMVSFSTEELYSSGAIALRKQLNNHFSLRANIFTGKLTGYDKNLSSHAARGYSFKSSVHEFALIGEYYFLGNQRTSQKRMHKMWSPYFLLGGGIALTNPKVDFNESQNIAQAANIAKDKANKTTRFAAMPIGFGVKYDLNDKMRLYAEAGIRWVFSDYLDGVSLAASPKQNDTYSFIGAGITFRLGAGKDTDKDGIKDSEDLCPDVAGIAKFKGCPDTDEDGVEDKKDQCPTEKGTIETKGCPDSDKDGIVDKKDECPTEKGLAAFKGCPDTDGDGIEDKKDQCPTEKGTIETKGCPLIKDSDNDGVADDKDQCPNDKGTIEGNGCPPKKETDKDKDGILDKDDLCPDKPGIATFYGCPDTDGDGIEDLKDECPDLRGTAKNAGCPELKKEDQQILKDATYGVQFESGSAILKQASNAILDKVAALMTQYPNYRLTIAGHTDNTGSESANQRLSQARAKACFDYLITKKIDYTRIIFQGYGSSKPIADNKTLQGRSQNRRVEFTLTAQ
jgi:OmpA-OmpF porin, OOP family